MVDGRYSKSDTVDMVYFHFWYFDETFPSILNSFDIVCLKPWFFPKIGRTRRLCSVSSGRPMTISPNYLAQKLWKWRKNGDAMFGGGMCSFWGCLMMGLGQPQTEWDDSVTLSLGATCQRPRLPVPSCRTPVSQVDVVVSTQLWAWANWDRLYLNLECDV